MPRTATVESCCTMGNFGPGFDVLSLALDRPGDRVTVAAAAADAVTTTGVGAATLPTGFHANVASVAVAHVRDAYAPQARFQVTVDKRVPPGSGLGSSASSAAAGARAAAAWVRAETGTAVPPDALLAAAVAGETVAAGAHRDDVSAALFGGLALVMPAPGPVLRLDPPAALRLAVVRPHVVLETKRMRAVLPDAMPRADVVHNLALVARLVDACHRGDVAGIGAAMDDRVQIPYRAPLVPHYGDVHDAALAAGAFGHSLSGSGPAQFAVTDSETAANTVLAAMLDVYKAAGVAVEGFTAGPRLGGFDDDDA